MIAPSGASGGGTIYGKVYYYDQYQNLHPLSWAQVIAEDVSGQTIVASSSTNGNYMIWAPPGSYNVTASSPSYGPALIPMTQSVVVSDGGSVGVDFYLQPSGKPVPEYPSPLAPVMLALAALAVVIMTRRPRARP
jgi:hypothetical protein